MNTTAQKHTLPTPDECPTLEEILYIQEMYIKEKSNVSVVTIENMTQTQLWTLATKMTLQNATKHLNVSATTIKKNMQRKRDHILAVQKICLLQ